MNDQILSVLVSNHFGVLTRVTSLFSRRGFNIKQLTVGETDDPEISRITIMTEGDETILDQIQKQLFKLEDVKKVSRIPKDDMVGHELLLIKVPIESRRLFEIRNYIDMMQAKILNSEQDCMVVEATGDKKSIDNFIEQMKEYGIMEICRTGIAALQTGKATIYGDIQSKQNEEE